MEVNLISDTVTQPSEGMLAAIQAAPVGDDVFKEDPTVNALEEEVADLFGMEKALFFPSGTMANQTAIKCIPVRRSVNLRPLFPRVSLRRWWGKL